MFIISRLEKKGVNIYMFEMPINSELIRSKRVILLREKLLNCFKHKVCFIPIDGAKYITSDGLHLNLSESINYTMYFDGKIKSLVN